MPLISSDFLSVVHIMLISTRNNFVLGEDWHPVDGWGGQTALLSVIVINADINLYSFVAVFGHATENCDEEETF